MHDDVHRRDKTSFETGEEIDATTRRELAAAGGLLGAIAASSCCLLPLVFTIAGLGGAWMVNLRALQPYKPFFAVVALAFISYGLWLAYLAPQRACAADGACEKRPIINSMIVKGILWISLLMVLLSVTIDWWFPLVRPYLP